jgi:hypothetical protein
MTESEVISQLIKHIDGLFPKTCAVCRSGFVTFRDYLLNTKHIGAVCFDVELNDWKPFKPVGTLSYANCRCGNTLSLTSKGMPINQLWQLLDWARIEMQKRDLNMRGLLNYLQDEICKQVLAISG